jgi:hypothetical protein
MAGISEPRLQIAKYQVKSLRRRSNRATVKKTFLLEQRNAGIAASFQFDLMLKAGCVSLSRPTVMAGISG